MTVERDVSDPNSEFYEANLPTLKEKYLGKWVAILDGKLVAVEEGQGELFKKLKEKRVTGFLYKQIKAEEKVIRLRSPRRRP